MYFIFKSKRVLFLKRIVFSYLNIKGWNVITVITSLGTRVLIGTPSEISKFGLFRQFCVQEFSANLELHELALQRGKVGKW